MLVSFEGVFDTVRCGRAVAQRQTGRHEVGQLLNQGWLNGGCQRGCRHPVSGVVGFCRYRYKALLPVFGLLLSGSALPAQTPGRPELLLEIEAVVDLPGAP
jgi:hypothetical protein